MSTFGRYCDDKRQMRTDGSLGQGARNELQLNDWRRFNRLQQTLGNYFGKCAKESSPDCTAYGAANIL
jgi:hypothetical protein